MQAKLRVRRATGSQKRLAQDQAQLSTTSDNIAKEEDFGEEFALRVGDLWENCEEIGKAVAGWASEISPQEMRLRIVRELSVMQCQVHSQELEQVVMSRVHKVGEMAKRERRCREQEDKLEQKFEDRMKKLRGFNLGR